MSIIKFKKGANIKLSKNFHLREFDCKCDYPECTETPVNLDHVQKMQEFRDSIKKSIKITSAYRCKKYNKLLGSDDTSQHVLGNATDIQVTGMSPDAVADGLEHMDGLGRYNTFTHVDSRGYKSRWDLRKK